MNWEMIIFAGIVESIAVLSKKNDMTNEVALTSEWYGALVEECSAIVVEKTKIAQQELTEMYLMLGARILEETKHAPVGKIIEAVSRDVKIGETNLKYAVAIVKKYGDDVNKLPLEGASISWNKAKKLISPPAGEVPESHFDPYACANTLWSKQTPHNCFIVGTELLRLWRESKKQL